MLVNKCRIYDKDSRVRFSHYKSVSKNKIRNHNRGNIYRDQMLRVNRSSNRTLHAGKEQMGNMLLLILSVSCVEDWDIVLQYVLL